MIPYPSGTDLRVAARLPQAKQRAEQPVASFVGRTISDRLEHDPLDFLMLLLPFAPAKVVAD